MSSDPRLQELDEAQPVHELGERHGWHYRLDRCPVIECHGERIYRALVVGPDGQQRAAWGCVKHLGILVEHALSQIRAEPH